MESSTNAEGSRYVFAKAFIRFEAVHRRAFSEAASRANRA